MHEPRRWDVSSRVKPERLADQSIHVVLADDVFLSMPFIKTRARFLEIARVLAPGGEAFFNVFTEDCFTDTIIERWLKTKHRYPCLVPAEYVRDFFKSRGFTVVLEHTQPHGPGVSRHFVIRRPP